MAAASPESGEITSDLTEDRFGSLCVVTVMTGEPWRQNCYVVADESSREALVVDPGARGDVVEAEVSRRGLTVRNVLLTHAHHDHVGAAASLCRAFGVECLISEGDARLLRQAALYAYRFGGRQIEDPKPVSYFQESTYRLGTHTVRIHPAPGHTEGGVVFEFPGFALTGDTLLFKHVGRTDMPGGNAGKLRESVDSLLRDLPATTVLFAGHGRTWTVSDASEWWRSVGDSPASLDSHASSA